MVEFEGKKCKSFILYFVLVFSVELVWWIFCKLTHAEFSLRALIILIFLLGVGGALWTASPLSGQHDSVTQFSRQPPRVAWGLGCPLYPVAVNEVFTIGCIMWRTHRKIEMRVLCSKSSKTFTTETADNWTTCGAPLRTGPWVIQASQTHETGTGGTSEEQQILSHYRVSSHARELGFAIWWPIKYFGLERWLLHKFWFQRKTVSL